MRTVLMIACLGTLCIHGVASRTHFASPHGTPRGMWLIRVLFLLSGIANVIVIGGAPIDRWQAGAALAVYGGAMWLFVAAVLANRRRPLSVAFSPDAPGHLVTNGPYRFIRHPFYTSYCLTWMAGAMATSSGLLAACAATMCVAYVVAARFEERKFRAGPFAREYARYRAQTGMFLPRGGVVRAAEVDSPRDRLEAPAERARGLRGSRRNRERQQRVHG